MTTMLERLPDGRVLGSFDVLPLAAQAGQPHAPEVKVATIARNDWRNCLDIFVNPNQNTGAENALVRVYGATRGARVELARGRVGVDNPREVVRLRGQGCDTYDLTLTRDYINTDQPTNPTNMVTVAFCAHGMTSSSDTDPVTRKTAPGGVFSGTLTKTPSRLFSANATNPNTVDLWLQFFDTFGGVPADGVVPTLPPVYIPAGGNGVAAIAFDRRPFEFQAGLVWAVSTAPGSKITPTGATPLVEFEYL